MKIIFDSEEQRNDFVELLGNTNVCPSAINGLTESCGSCEAQCEPCWEKAIEMEVS